MIDQTDIEILNLLTRNSRMQWQEIGEEVVELLDEILQYGNYKINLSIENIK